MIPTKIHTSPTVNVAKKATGKAPHNRFSKHVSTFPFHKISLSILGDRVGSVEVSGDLTMFLTVIVIIKLAYALLVGRI